MRPQPMIVVNDVPASSRWYQSLLNVKSGHGGDEYEQLVREDGTLILQLHEGDDTPAAVQVAVRDTKGEAPSSFRSGLAVQRDGGIWRSFEPPVSAWKRVKGQVTYEHLEPDAIYRVFVYRPTGAFPGTWTHGLSAPFAAATGTREIAVTVQDPVPVRVQVTGPDGAPVTDVRLRATWTGVPIPNFQGPATTVVAIDGTVHWSLPHGPWRIEALRLGEVVAVEAMEVTANRPVSLQLELHD